MSLAPLRSTPPSGRPFLLPGRPSRSRARSPLAYWHLLSLDAPTVAATWAAFISWCAGAPTSHFDPLAIFLAVWVLYAADRLLDARPLFTSPATAHLEERHHFHHRHRRRFLSAVLLASVPLVILLHMTPDPVLHLYILLASLLGVWLLLVHARSAPSANQHRLPKELAVGLFFPAAVFIPTVARAPWLRITLLPDAIAFAAVCTLNCLYLYAWEHPVHRDEAHPSTRWAVNHLNLLALLSALASAAWAVRVTELRPSESIPYPAAAPLACASAIALLLLLASLRRRIAPLTLRALADLCLLTPLPVFLAFTVAHR